ncbi:MAG TPA: hypothetical protein VF227_09985 [Actinomycetes bacterium]
MSVTVESLHERGRTALLDGRERLDVPPDDGSRRWGLSVLVRPQQELADRLDQVTGELVALAGPGQWATGAFGTAHLTLYSLEPHRPGLTLADPAAGRYAEAMARAAAATPPATFAVTGLGLTPGGVIAACRPLDGGARALRPELTAALGGDAFEAAYRGDQWWVSLLHLAAPVAHAAELVAFVEARREVPLGTLDARRLELVRYQHTEDPAGHRMVPVTLAEADLTGVRGAADGAQA